MPSSSSYEKFPSVQTIFRLLSPILLINFLKTETFLMPTSNALTRIFPYRQWFKRIFLSFLVPKNGIYTIHDKNVEIEAIMDYPKGDKVFLPSVIIYGVKEF